MILRDISFDRPEENILFDEVLLQLAEEGLSDEVLRLWESPSYFVVLGRIGRADEDVKQMNVKENRIPVLRRSSGGGTVLQGPGCLNYSLILSKESHPAIADLKKSYQHILGKVVNALSNEGIIADYLPISDIVLKSSLRKFSGNAQKRGKKFILHHGTILYDFDLKLVEEYLLMPKDMPEYRKHRGHLEFVTNISVDAVKIKEAMAREFNAQPSTEGLAVQEKERMQKLVDGNKTILLVNH
ncbi:MAG: lipoate--protein ligase family protein [Candidatus Omnitrophica bacterium]|nr:lipoate--protein ligase family protein [Candidatus Omnitrophota bacterium]